jgi:spore germination protein YaaH
MSLSLLLASSLAFAADPLAAPPGEHARQWLANPDAVVHHPVTPARLPAATPGPDVIVYGYQAYWSDDLASVPWDQLSHLALFAAEVDSSGNLSHTDRWDDAADAVAIAQEYGVKVHLCVINFDTSSMSTLLGSTTARNHLIDQLADAVESTGADGVNIDFEGLSSSRKQEMIDFVADLDARVPDVVLATPAVDWSGAWDYSELSRHADLFVMAYGYHWGGSGSAGPVDPLYGADPWDYHAIDWTIDDYVANGADPARVILGLPLYGYSWPVSGTAVPATTTGTGSAVLWADAKAAAAANGEHWDDASHTPYYDAGGRQVWYGNVDSLRERTSYAVDSEIGGIGFWALHYDEGDAALWAMIDEETVIPSPGDPPDDPPPDEDFVADAGAPFLAYPGDTIILSGQGSSGPPEVHLEFRWTQVAGPSVALSDATVKEPQFVVTEPGTAVFELIVGDGTSFSIPDRSYVVVLDPDAGERHADGKGCDHTGSAASIGLALAAGALRRRPVRMR